MLCSCPACTGPAIVARKSDPALLAAAAHRNNFAPRKALLGHCLTQSIGQITSSGLPPTPH